MTVERTGTAASNTSPGQTGSFAVTVPSDADVVVVYQTSWVDSNGATPLDELCWDGGNTFDFTVLKEQLYDNSGGYSDYMTVGAYYMTSDDANWPGSGSKTLYYDWNGSVGGSETLFVQFYKNVDKTSPVVGTDSTPSGPDDWTSSIAGVGAGDLGCIAVMDFIAVATNEPDVTPTGEGQTEVFSYFRGDEYGGLAIGEEVGEGALRAVSTEANGYMVTIAFVLKESSGGYTITAAGGSMTITGTAAGLLYNRKMSAAAGSVAITGTVADLLYNRALDAGAGSILITGGDAALLYNRLLSVDAGSIVLTGFDVTLRYGSTTTLTAEPGAYVVTGGDATLLYHRLLDAEAGAITLTGFDATLTYNEAGGPEYTLTADAGAMALAGQDARLLYHRIMAADAGALVITGTDAGLYFNRAITAEAGAIVITGTDIDLLRAARIVAEAGSITLTGFAATLDYSGALIPQGRVTVTLTARQPGAALTARQPGITLTAR